MTQTLKEPIGIIKLSVGGTSLAAGWSPQRSNSLYGKLRALGGEAAKTRPLRIVGMVWVQGGADARVESMAGVYHDNLRSFIQEARQGLNSPDMVFVCGRSAAPADKYPHVGLVRKAQMSIDLPGYAWVDCDSIPTGTDRVHYSTAGQVQAGRLLADAMLELLKGNNTNPPRAPDSE